MYNDIPLLLSLTFVIGGLVALAWSSDFFVDGASALAKALGISPMIIGMVIIGFGTSAPELCVSALSGLAGHSNLSLGNAYGSCIFNISMVLGVSVLIFPLVVRPSVTWVAGGILTMISGFAYLLLEDGECTRGEAAVLLGVFAVLLPAYCWFDNKMKGSPDSAKAEKSAGGVEESKSRIWIAAAKTLIGLGVLVGSSHLLVWGAVDLAKTFGVSDLMIGLTIVAIGTSLPELASGIASARRGEHEFVLGNIIGSNFFNTLAVVGIATVISPITKANGGFSPYVLSRDLPLMALLSFSLIVFGLNWRHLKWPGVIRRWEAVIWILIYAGYTVLMFLQERGAVVAG